MPTFNLDVNGRRQPVSATADTPLLHVLRNDLNLHGPRFGCGLAQCGACGVLVGGREIRSCVTPVAGVVGKKITTLEGLSSRWVNQAGLSGTQAKTALHPVQQAWIEGQVPQCGFCQNGMMIMAVDLLERVPNPTRAQIMQALTKEGPSPHLCRCGTYHSIIGAVELASKKMRAAKAMKA